MAHLGRENPWPLLVFLSVVASGCADSGFPVPPSERGLPSLRLTSTGSRLFDVRGREVLLRGVNAGGRSKFSPFFPFAFAESGLAQQRDAPPFEVAAATYLDRVADWGLSVVRLPFSWEAVEPTRGQYDELFISRYRRLAELCGERDIRVIVDFHQDVFARPYCGDGFPLWACPQPVPEPPDDCSEWFMAYLDPDSAASHAFDRFWANEDGLREAFVAMWERMAAELWPVDAVIGFEIINEPHPGSAARPAWDDTVLAPFYEQVAGAIRQVAPGALVFFDAAGIDASLAATTITLPAGQGWVFAPHYYGVSAFVPGLRHDPELIARHLGRWAAKRTEWSVPVIVGEFGIGAERSDALDYIRAHYDALDAHLLHATQWEYSTTTDDWNDEGMSIAGPDGADTVLVSELVRPHCRAVTGELTRFSFDVDERRVEWTFVAAAGGLSELAIPARVYPNGVEATVSGNAGASLIAEGQTLFVHASARGEVTVIVVPR